MKNNVLNLLSDSEYVSVERYYLNGVAQINHQSVKYHYPNSPVWASNVIARQFSRVEIIESIKKTNNGFQIKLTPEGEECEFLQFIFNTSNFTPVHASDLSGKVRERVAQAAVNKITAIGYLLCNVRFEPVPKAVILRDNHLPNSGKSHSGTGKTIFAKAIGEIAAQYEIFGGDFIPDDQFSFANVTPRIENILIEEFRADVSIRCLFNYITAPMRINRKGRAAIVLPTDMSPKILITTNNEIKHADDGSARVRLAYVDFSNWYNENHTPLEDFSLGLFSGWDTYQWILFDNFMAECVMYYLRSNVEGWGEKGLGIVPAPVIDAPKNNK